jgi:hypothetical protein
MAKAKGAHRRPKTTGKRQRKPSPLDRRLATYGLAAGAVLAGGTAAQGEIIYSGVQDIIVNSGNPSPEINLDGAGATDLKLGWYATTSMYQQRHGVAERVNNGASVLRSGMWLMKRLDSGAAIASAVDWGVYAHLFKMGGVPQGQFTPETGYFGVRFDPAGGPNYKYGWVHVDNVASDYTSYHVNGWAYEDVAGEPILAGQTSGGAPPVPEASTLVLFAAGAAGILAWRRRRRPPEE